MFLPNPEGTIDMPPRGVAPSRSMIVAVKAEKVISNTALSWAITHVARPGDCILLLAVFSEKMTGGRSFWGFPRLKGDNRRSSDRNKLSDRIGQISESCSQMVLQFHSQIQVGVQIKVVSALSAGSVADEAKRNAANWVILDKKLKREIKNCMDELRCNTVIMKGSRPKILRLNLSCSNDLETPFYSAAASPHLDSEKLQSQRTKHSTPVSSPEGPSTFCARTLGTNSLVSLDTGTSIFVVYGQNPLYEGLNKGNSPPGRQKRLVLRENTETFSTIPGSRTQREKKICWIPQNHIVSGNYLESGNCKDISNTAYPTPRTEMDKFVQFNQDIIRGTKLNQNIHRNYEFNYSIREAVALGRSSSTPPPLCSLCQYKAPAFGKPPRQFHYSELEEATDGFSDKNFIAEGGFGLGHRGVLRNGMIIVVKRLKLFGSQREDDFCSQVRLLSCAQHRNVVLLIGFCIEGKKRLLVYEYICNGSLDFHLHGEKRMTLDWQSRLKIAIGTARGLRYLHEDCRVGRMIHRDIRPKNILLTHDFEPLVAGFGLETLHCEWDFCDGNQMVKASGYLAPEYFNGGNMTEKVDVYAFGLVLLELITGERASDLLYCIDRQLLANIFHPSSAIEPIQPMHMLAYKHQLLESCLASYQIHSLPYEIQAMGYAASLCLQQNPELRPPMSKVLRILEGGSTVTSLALDMNSVGSRSGHMEGLNSKRQLESKMRHSRRLSY